jgi:flagellar biosynthetic protein FliR
VIGLEDQAAREFLAALPGVAFAFVLVLGRVGSAMTLLPGLGEAELPMMVRAGLAICVSALLLPGIAPMVGAAPGDVLAMAGMVLAEVATGLWLGWLARMVVLALPIAGQMISYMLGLSNVLQPDAELGAQATALGRMLALAAPVVVLASGLYAPALAALAGSYRLVAPGALVPAGDLAQTALGAMAQGFALALRLASPFVLACVVWQVSIGLMARLVPRLQVYFAAMPAQILGGLAMFAALISMLLGPWQAAVRDVYAGLPGLL